MHVRYFGFVVLLLSAASCQESTAPVAIEGTYELHLVNGSPLPFALDWLTPNEEPPHITGGSVVITPGWLILTERVERRDVDWTGDTTILYNENGIGGEYIRAGNVVTLRHRSTFSETVHIQTFVIERDGVLRSKGNFLGGEFFRIYCRADAC